MQGMDVILVSLLLGLFVLAMILVVGFYVFKMAKKLNLT